MNQSINQSDLEWKPKMMQAKAFKQTKSFDQPLSFINLAFIQHSSVWFICFCFCSPGLNVVEQVLPAVVDILQGPVDLCLLSLVAGQ